MPARDGVIKFLGIIALFLFLELFSIFLIKRNGIIQKYTIGMFTYKIEAFFWEKGEKVRNYFNLKEINDALVEDNMRLQATADSYYMLLDKRDSNMNFIYQEIESPYSYLSARIIKNSTNKQTNYILLDKGRKDGVEEDMGVITSRGVIGVVQSVSENLSLVTSFLNYSQGISAIIQSNNTFGTLIWPGNSIDKALLREIPLHTNIVIGDTIVTSGYSAIYPPNIPLGTIASSRVVDGINFELTIDLFENYRSVSNVFIVKNKYKEEIDYIHKNQEFIENFR